MIHLTPQDIGKEFMTREGKREECVDEDDEWFKFSDDLWRDAYGLSDPSWLGTSNLDIISRINDEVKS